MPDLRPDGLQFFDDGARLAFLFRGFEVGARLVRLDQVTRDATPFMSAAARISSNSWSETRMKIRLPAGPSRPVLLVPAMGLMLLSMFPGVAAVSPFALADVAGDVKPPSWRCARRRPKAFGTRVNANRHGAVGGISGLCAQTV